MFNQGRRPGEGAAAQSSTARPARDTRTHSGLSPTFPVEELAVIVGPEVNVLYDVALHFLPVNGLVFSGHFQDGDACVCAVGAQRGLEGAAFPGTER